MKAKLGPNHPDTLVSMNSLATAYQATGKLDQAVPLFVETLKLMKANLGPDHPETLIAMNNLAGAYRHARKLDLALPLFAEALRLSQAKLGPDNLTTLATAFNMAEAYMAAGKQDQSLPLLEYVYQRGKKYSRLRGVGHVLLDGYAGAGKMEQAVALAKDLIADSRISFPGKPPTGYAVGKGCFTIATGPCSSTEAEPLLRECLAIREKTQADEWTTFSTKSMLGGALLGQKKYADAGPLLLAGYEGMKHARQKSR